MTNFDEGKFAPKEQIAGMRKEVSQAEVNQIYEMPAIYCNKYYVTVQPDGMVRLAFADTDPNEKFANNRFSVIMPAMAFVSFVRLLEANMSNVNNMIQAIRQAIPQAMPMVVNEDKGKIQ